MIAFRAILSGAQAASRIQDRAPEQAKADPAGGSYAGRADRSAKGQDPIRPLTTDCSA